MRGRMYLIFSFFAVLCSAFSINPFRHSVDSADQGFVIDTLVTNLVVPWQIVFLTDTTMLFTEREGRLRIYRKGKLLPKPAFIFQNLPLNNKSGLLGMCIHPDFVKNRFIYLANNYLDGSAMRLKVVRYQFKNDTLSAPKTILENIPANRNHTGCRLVFGPDKKLYISTGDADQPALSQDLKAYNGKILRVNDDGSIPSDNPFVQVDSARKEIWSYGHRNPQGLAFQPKTNFLYSSEHGPTGGDEINRIQKGMNYGWPFVHHLDKREGMISPLFQYTPSIGPAEAMFYNGNQFPSLKGKLLVACLRGESVLVLNPEKDSIMSQQVFLKKQYGRIRSIVTGPDGFIYFSTSQIDPAEGMGGPPFDMILRLRPSGNGNFAFTNLNNAIGQKNNSNKISTEQLVLQMCSSCHGNDLKGSPKAGGLVGRSLLYGSDKQSISRNIANGITEKGMPSWKGAIAGDDIEKITDYILTKRTAYFK